MLVQVIDVMPTAEGFHCDVWDWRNAQRDVVQVSRDRCCFEVGDILSIGDDHSARDKDCVAEDSEAAIKVIMTKEDFAKLPIPPRFA